jgi:regulator of sigma E protease
MAKTKIMAAGIAVNFLAAIFLFMVVAWIGMPQLIDGQFTVASDSHLIKEAKNKDIVKAAIVDSGSPAAKAGIKVNSQIISINGSKITSAQQVLDATKANAGKTITVVTKKDGKQQTYRPTLNSKSPFLGLAPQSAREGFDIRRSTWSAPIVALGVTRDFTIATFKGLGTALKGVGSIVAGAVTGNKEARQTGQTEASNQVSGPVGIFAVLYNGASQGIGFILFVVGIISLSLAIMNVLPIPALDGGKLFITYMSRLFGKKISENFENYAYGISFMLLIGLMILITVVDVRRFVL